MRETSPRLVTARHWTGLLLATTALGAGMAEARMVPSMMAPVMGGGQTVWLAEGGEGGEAGAVAGVDTDSAYLVRLAIVEGHLLAAAALYRAGRVDDAVGLSYHPEAEMMDDVRESLAVHGQGDFTPLMQAFSSAMEGGAADVTPELAAFQAAVAGAIGAEAPDAAKRFAVAVAVLQAAAAEYAGSIEDGVVTDVLAYHEAQAFVDVARGMVAGIAGDAAMERLGARAVAAMGTAAEAFGMADGTFAAKDPAILLGVAARVELISSQVR